MPEEDDKKFKFKKWFGEIVGATVATAGGGAVLTAATGGSDFGTAIIGGAISGFVGGFVYYPFTHFYGKWVGE
jgi:hypothetical protein